MTDTTDTKALSYARLIEVRNILSGFEDGYDTVADRENYEAMRDTQASIDELISLRGKLRESNHLLEAERQRDDELVRAKDNATYEWGEAQRNYDSAKSKIRSLEAEIAALKTDIEYYIRISNELATEVEALKGKLANPVVLPSRFKPEVSKVDMFKGSPVMKLDATGGWLNRTGVIVALNEAGFTVKGDL